MYLSQSMRICLYQKLQNQPAFVCLENINFLNFFIIITLIFTQNKTLNMNRRYLMSGLTSLLSFLGRRYTIRLALPFVFAVVVFVVVVVVVAGLPIIYIKEFIYFYKYYYFILVKQNKI
jgi:hypothetical protein